MEESLVQLLFGIVEVLFEALIEIAGEAILAGIARAIRAAFDREEFAGPVVATLGFVLLGAFTGLLSIFVLPHRLFPPSRFHGLSLILSPLITGSVMSFIGSSFRRHDKEPTRIESFGYGFAFALGMSLVRFFVLR